uniref:Uncharacterized protein n=1 Tax=Coccidioides posadasii RMSCC 3488 TaxID=454284 RepID=A0A0J6FB08_COCPO|nr:hypothetical protein CPAG_03777 [Coccidioides posadasii RMSCC 3488]
MPRTRTEKTMSSRLLTMKFMQRAAASSGGPATPSSQTSTVDAETSTPSPKRQKLSNNASRSDMRAISAAIRAEEEKRAAAIAKQAAEAGETQWVLEFPARVISNTPTPTVVTTADPNDTDEELEYGGRRSYGNFKKKTKTPVRSVIESLIVLFYVSGLFFPWSLANTNEQIKAYATVEEKQGEAAESSEQDEVLALIRSAQPQEQSKRNNRGQSNRQNQDRARKGISSGGGRQSDEVDLRKLNSISGGMSREKKPAGGKRKEFR